jgi:hypothetical protein
LRAQSRDRGIIPPTAARKTSNFWLLSEHFNDTEIKAIPSGGRELGHAAWVGVHIKEWSGHLKFSKKECESQRLTYTARPHEAPRHSKSLKELSPTRQHSFAAQRQILHVHVVVQTKIRIRTGLNRLPDEAQMDFVLFSNRFRVFKQASFACHSEHFAHKGKLKVCGSRIGAGSAY